MHASLDLEESKQLLDKESKVDSGTEVDGHASQRRTVSCLSRPYSTWTCLYFGCIHLILFGIFVRLYAAPKSIQKYEQERIYSQ
jgi:hypothetical protein